MTNDTVGQGRVRPAAKLDLLAAVEAGIAGGVVLLLVWMFALSLPRYGSPWAVLRMVAALVLGRDTLTPASHGEGVLFVLVGLGVHLLLAVLYALPLAMLVKSLARSAPVLTGVAWGLFLFLFNFSALVEVFDWFQPLGGWINLFGHLAYGALAGWSYVRFALPREHRREVRIMHSAEPVTP